MLKQFLDKIFNDDCLQVLRNLPDNSVDCVITDPPYFIDGMDNNWNKDKLKAKTAKAGVVGGLPVGMKFDRKQGPKLQEFMEPIATELFRVLKPGAFCVVFSSPRLYHRMAMPFDTAGFEIRDMMAWEYSGQPKAFSMNHFIKRLDLSEGGKRVLALTLDGWKTPQLKPQMEPMVLAQKPRDGTFIENFLKHNVGLMNTKQSLHGDGEFPGQLMPVPKRYRLKCEHITAKPVVLIEHLIKLFTREGQVILDPFSGSGAHLFAAKRTNRHFIGVEINKSYYEESTEWLKSMRIS